MADDGGSDISLPKGGVVPAAAGTCSASLRCAHASPWHAAAATIAKLVKDYIPKDLRTSSETTEKLLECCTGAHTAAQRTACKPKSSAAHLQPGDKNSTRRTTAAFPAPGLRSCTSGCRLLLLSMVPQSPPHHTPTHVRTPHPHAPAPPRPPPPTPRVRPRGVRLSQ